MMARRIDVEVGKGGQITVEYSGFEGETCFDEAGTLEKALKELGLWAIPLTVTRKTATDIEHEVGFQEETKKKVPLS